MRNIELIIFDLDGTLVDAYRAIIKSFSYTMRALKARPQSCRTIRKAVGWGDENLLRPFIHLKDFKKALFIYRRHHKEALVKESRLFPDVERVLRYLKDKGYKLAVASNRPTYFSRILIRHLKLDKYFDYILCADRLKHIKPHPEILIKIMHSFRIKPSQTIYVGDMSIDAQAGRRAGVKTVIVSTGSSTVEEIKKAKPYHIIKKIIDLLEMPSINSESQIPNIK